MRLWNWRWTWNTFAANKRTYFDSSLCNILLRPEQDTSSTFFMSKSFDDTILCIRGVIFVKIKWSASVKKSNSCAIIVVVAVVDKIIKLKMKSRLWENRQPQNEVTSFPVLEDFGISSGFSKWIFMLYYELCQYLKDVYNSVNSQFQMNDHHKMLFKKNVKIKRSQNAGPDHRISENMSFINMVASALTVNMTFDKRPLRKFWWKSKNIPHSELLLLLHSCVGMGCSQSLSTRRIHPISGKAQEMWNPRNLNSEPHSTETCENVKPCLSVIFVHLI